MYKLVNVLIDVRGRKGRGKGRHLVNEQYVSYTSFHTEAVKDPRTSYMSREDIPGSLN